VAAEAVLQLVLDKSHMKKFGFGIEHFLMNHQVLNLVRQNYHYQYYKSNSGFLHNLQKHRVNIGLLLFYLDN